MQLPESATGTVAREIRRTKHIDTARTRLTQSDPYLIQRLVGYHEYGRALNYLDLLVSRCDEYELAAVEEIVRSEPEFAIYTIAAGDVPGERNVQQPDERDIPAEFEQPSGPARRRHGLRWLTALARVELGAMYAGFSQSPRPFSHAGSPGYDRAEFQELLAESARVHYWTLSRDPVYRALTKTFRPTPLTLRYLRRLNIATGLAVAGQAVATKRQQPQAQRELANYGMQMHRERRLVQQRIHAYMALSEVSSGAIEQRKDRLILTELCNQGACRQFADPSQAVP